jgi:hypothetical protein
LAFCLSHFVSFTSSYEFDFPNSPSATIAVSSSPNTSQTNTLLPNWKESEADAMRSRSASLGSSGRSEISRGGEKAEHQSRGGSVEHTSGAHAVHSLHRERQERERGERDRDSSAAHHRPSDTHQSRERERPRNTSSHSTFSTSPTVQFAFDAICDLPARRVCLFVESCCCCCCCFFFFGLFVFVYLFPSA